MQQKYGALLVNFNNQQVELAAAKKSVDTLKAEVKSLKSQMKSPEGQLAVVQGAREHAAGAASRRGPQHAVAEEDQ